MRGLARIDRGVLVFPSLGTPSAVAEPMASVRWTLATTLGFVLGGVALHSPGASGVGNSYLDWDVSAALFGLFLGALVGVVTALLQVFALQVRSWRLVLAAVIAVGIAHALADGAPSVWGPPIVAALSGMCAALPLAWALRLRAWRWIFVSALAWWAGWTIGVAVAGALRLSGGATPDVWAREHALIALCLGLAWGAATSPFGRRALAEELRTNPLG